MKPTSSIPDSQSLGAVPWTGMGLLYSLAKARMPHTATVVRHAFLVATLGLFSTSACANAFIPTMISANVVWMLVLAPVVVIEGWLMARWKWARPYKTAFGGNLLSMLAALPVGVLLSLAGAYLTDADARSTLSFLPDTVRFFLAQVLFYGDTPVPSYGFVGSFSSAGVFLAALIFIGLCWLLTFVIEGSYYLRKNPSFSRKEIFLGAALANVASYCFLVSLWLPYSYYAASAAQESFLRFCAEPSAWSNGCTGIWEKFPEVREFRLSACGKRGIPEGRCLEKSN
jgi:hypothetical protein